MKVRNNCVKTDLKLSNNSNLCVDSKNIADGDVAGLQGQINVLQSMINALNEKVNQISFGGRTSIQNLLKELNELKRLYTIMKQNQDRCCNSPVIQKSNDKDLYYDVLVEPVYNPQPPSQPKSDIYLGKYIPKKKTERTLDLTNKLLIDMNKYGDRWYFQDVIGEEFIMNNKMYLLSNNIVLIYDLKKYVKVNDRKIGAKKISGTIGENKKITLLIQQLVQLNNKVSWNKINVDSPEIDRVLNSNGV